MGNRHGKTTASSRNMSEEAGASRSTRRVLEVSDPPAVRGFGRFVFELKESFTVSNAVSVATVLELPAAQRDRIAKDTDGHVFTELLQEKGIISPTDIARLIEATRTVGLQGIADEVQESFSRNVSSNRLSPHINTEFQRKKDQFLTEIKETYEAMYNGVQPVPYIRERLLCVDKVFIDSGIEYLKKQGFSTSDGTWEKLDSYNSIFTDPRLAHAMVYILLGEPGYGKSTFALQFAYDWCNRCPDSPLKDEEILIFLRLRYLKGGMPLVKAIKQFLLPSDSTLNEGDISSIIQDCKSVVIIFDGFDEYASRDDTDDVMKILARQMLRNCKVVLTTRPSSKPPRLTHKTEQVRLTGFDDQARERYVLKAVVDGNSEAAAKILQRLQQSPVFADICQVSLFFVMFAHMTHERDMSVVFESVTSFFRYVVSSFYEHKQIRAGTVVGATVKDMHTAENDKLYKFAFESLRGKDQKLVWRKETFIKLIGESLYNELVEIGILVEENVVEIVDDPGTFAADHIQRKTDVSFYHKLLCEWYAAHYVAAFVNSSEDGNLSGFFEGIDPFDLQYVYRIGCGLSPTAADKIIQYLHSIEGGDKFAILCILEKTGDMENIKETIRQICFEGVIISGYDSLLLQRSSMQLLEIAARFEIPIEFVQLYNCLQSVDLSTSAIRTTSGLALTSRIPVKELWVSLSNRDMTKDEAIDILQFGSMCPSLRVLWYGICVPPRVFTDKSTLSSLQSRDVTVWWRWADGEPDYILNLQTGRWKNENDGSEPTEEDFERMLSEDNENRKGWTEETYKGWVKEDRERLRELAEKERAKLRGEALVDEDDSDDGDVSEEYSDTT